MKKAIVFLAEGFEEVEALTVVDILRRGCIEVCTMSIMKDIMVNGAHNIEVKADCLYDEDNIDDADMIILPGGGLGTENLKAHNGVNKYAAKFIDEEKYVGAICAAPSVLGVKGLLKGRTAVCYPGFEEQLLGADIGKNSVEIDGNIITSKGVGTAIEFALVLVGVLVGVENSEKIKNAIVY